jgi:hypothetical protein
LAADILLEALLARGAASTQVRAEVTLQRVYDALGLVPLAAT